MSCEKIPASSKQRPASCDQQWVTSPQMPRLQSWYVFIHDAPCSNLGYCGVSFAKSQCNNSQFFTGYHVMMWCFIKNSFHFFLGEYLLLNFKVYTPMWPGLPQIITKIGITSAELLVYMCTYIPQGNPGYPRAQFLLLKVLYCRETVTTRWSRLHKDTCSFFSNVILLLSESASHERLGL